MENKWKADVAFVISKNYIGQFKVTFNSLINSNGGAEFRVHLFHGDLDECDREDLSRFTKERGGSITFYQIDDGMFEGMPKMNYDNSYSAYYKVLLPYYFNSLGKVLFLDCDIIVRGSIKPLFEMQSEAFLSCAADYKINEKNKSHVQKITGDAALTYFNSGVMLFDYSKSEQLVSKEELFGYITANKDIIRWHDQDILNHFYADKYRLLDEKYNYLTTYKSIKDIFSKKGRRNAVIVHYANWKPWKSNYIGKCYKLYKSNYKLLKGEKNVNFLKRRSPFAQLKLILKYVFR